MSIGVGDINPSDLQDISDFLLSLSEHTNPDGTENMFCEVGGFLKRVSTENVARVFNGFQSVKSETVTLSSAQLLDLGTAKELLPAPGVGKMYDVLRIVYIMKYNTTAYSINTSIQPFIGDSGSIPVANNTSVLGASAKSMIRPGIYTTGVNVPMTYAENKNLNLLCASGNPIGGDGTLDVQITYQIIDV